MADQHRSLPGRPSLRFLKLEAKRRRTAGEFATLLPVHLAREALRPHAASTPAAHTRVLAGS
jgi:hypothetical protein